MPFETEFWHGAEQPPRLIASLTTFHDRNELRADRARALAGLLNDEDVVVRGIALDTIGQLHAQTRQGSVPLLELLEDEVYACATRELHGPPYVPPVEGARQPRGANHGSAFYAMLPTGSDDEASLIAKALGENADAKVLEFGLQAAAGSLIRRTTVPAALRDRIQRVADDRGLDIRVRRAAIAATFGVATSDFDGWLLERVSDGEIAIAAAAARSLVERDVVRFRDVVSPLARKPATKHDPYDLVEIRMRLDELAD